MHSINFKKREPSNIVQGYAKTITNLQQIEEIITTIFSNIFIIITLNLQCVQAIPIPLLPYQIIQSTRRFQAKDVFFLDMYTQNLEIIKLIKKKKKNSEMIKTFISEPKV